MGFLKGLEDVFGEVEKSLDNLVGEISKQVNPYSSQQQEMVTNKKCPKCGGAIPISAKFCSNCGEEYKDIRDSEGQEIWPVIPEDLCYYCGAKIAISMDECKVCHSKIR